MLSPLFFHLYRWKFMLWPYNMEEKWLLLDFFFQRALTPQQRYVSRCKRDFLIFIHISNVAEKKGWTSREQRVDVSVVRTWKVVYHRYILVQRFILKIYMRFHSFIKHMIYFFFAYLLCLIYRISNCVNLYHCSFHIICWSAWRVMCLPFNYVLTFTSEKNGIYYDKRKFFFMLKLVLNAFHLVYPWMI